MEDQLNVYQLSTVTRQMDKLSSAIDKICERIERLEKDLDSRSLNANIKKKVISMLFFIYPAAMFFMMWISSVDHSNIQDAVSKYNSTITKAIEIADV